MSCGCDVADTFNELIDKYTEATCEVNGYEEGEYENNLLHSFAEGIKKNIEIHLRDTCESSKHGRQN